MAALLNSNFTPEWVGSTILTTDTNADTMLTVAKADLNSESWYAVLVQFEEAKVKATEATAITLTLEDGTAVLTTHVIDKDIDGLRTHESAADTFKGTVGFAHYLNPSALTTNLNVKITLAGTVPRTEAIAMILPVKF